MPIKYLLHAHHDSLKHREFWHLMQLAVQWYTWLYKPADILFIQHTMQHLHAFITNQQQMKRHKQ